MGIKHLENINRWDSIFRSNSGVHSIFENMIIGVRISLVVNYNPHEVCKAIDILSVFSSSKIFLKKIKINMNQNKLVQLGINVKCKNFNEFFDVFSFFFLFGKNQNVYISINENICTCTFYFYNINEISFFADLESDLIKWSQPIEFTFFINSNTRTNFSSFLNNYITFFNNNFK